jgi:glucosamine--fructose-6-phosphate aminotransferase (isomerizing)
MLRSFLKCTSRFSSMSGLSYRYLSTPKPEFSSYNSTEYSDFVNSHWGKIFLLATGIGLYGRKKFDESCGIIGYIGTEAKAIEVLLHGLEQLQNRGYDSAGVATIHNEEVRVTKYASDDLQTADALKRLKGESRKHENSYIGIGHTRWATHGGRTDNNAHPHTDHKNRIFLVHNGTISNVTDIRERLRSRGIPVKTETDTELIALMIGTYLDEGHTLKMATTLALQQLTGTWGIAVFNRENPGEILVARKGSPMLVGIGENEMYAASEVSAFSKYTDKYYALKEDELLVLDPKNKVIEHSQIQKTKEAYIEHSKGSYAHWTLKEIEEQPEAVARALNYGARLLKDGAKLRGLDEVKDQMLAVKNLMMIGCGTSYHAGLFGSHIFKQLGILNTVQVIDGSEFVESDIPLEKPGTIAISQSGETYDVIRPLKLLVDKHVPAISIVNVVGSAISTLAGHGVYMNAGREVGVASTKSFVNSCIILTLIALWYSKELHPEDTKKRTQIVNSLLRLPMEIGSVIAQTKNQIHELADDLKNEQHIFVLGRGLGESIAKEGALKIKEISYIHAEGAPGGALKHGPFALIKQGTPIILIILDDENRELMNNALHEVKSRGARTIVITTDKHLVDAEPSHIIQIADNGLLSSLLAVIPLQLLAYYLSISREIDPDHPQNLAKVVTVA